MRRLLHIFVFVTLLGFVLSGCRQSAAERRLVEIDTLIARGTYDSALLRLRAIDTTTLSRDELAYHGLLMAHAAYKAYDSTYLDTTWISRARAAYADGGSYDRHIRTLLYSGCVAEELGDPLAAMKWYKRTELEARPEDHYCIGYAQMSIATLYQRQPYANKQAVSFFRQAAHHFVAIDDSSHYIFCISQLGAAYRTINNDSARFFINKTINLALALNARGYYFDGLTSFAGLYYRNNDFNRCKQYAVKVASEGSQYTDSLCFYYAAMSYAALGYRDSALYYLKSTRIPQNEKDSILLYDILSRLNISSFRGCDSSLNDDILTDSVMRHSHKAELMKAESEQVTSVITKDKVKDETVLRKYTWITAFLLAFIMFIIIRHILRVRKLKNLANQSELLLRNKIEELNNLGKQHDKLVSSITAQIDIFNKVIIVLASNKSAKIQRNELKKLMTPTFFSHVYHCVNTKYDGLANSLLESSSITTREANIACLHFCGFPNFVILCYMDVTNLHTITNTKKIIATKLLNKEDGIDDIPLKWTRTS